MDEFILKILKNKNIINNFKLLYMVGFVHCIFYVCFVLVEIVCHNVKIVIIYLNCLLLTS